MGRTSNAKERLKQAVTELIWSGSYGSTTVDQICERAGVNKGSFYYFFESKVALATEAIEAGWAEFSARLDHVFSPAVPPLERILRFCEFEYQEQAELKKRHGNVLGCPLCTLGAEISTREAVLREKVAKMMDLARSYFETAIRDAHAQGAIHAPDPVTKSKAVYAYIEGLLTQARIRNDLELLRGMQRGVLDILGFAGPGTVSKGS